MIKVIVYVTKAIVALAASLLFCSCNFRQVEGNGNVTTQKREVGGSFRSVTVGHGLELIIEQGNQTSVIVEADENLQQHIKTEVRDGELVIKSDANINGTSAKIIVSTPQIDGIEATSGSTVKSKNTIKGDVLELSGSSGSEMDVSVDVNNLTCDSSSGSSVIIKGKAEKFETEASSGSSINAKALVAKSIISNSSSSGSVVVNPTESLTAEASSGGSVNYVNRPGNLNEKTSSGGSISQE